MTQPVNATMPQVMPYAQMPYSMPYAAPQATPYQVPQNNAVKIDIINPQAGTAAQPYATMPQMPAYNTYAMPQATTYGYPTASAYTTPMPYPYQPIPAQTQPQEAPYQYQPLPYNMPQAPQVVNNAPQTTQAPAPVIQQEAAPVEQVAQQPVVQEAPAAAPKIETPTQTPVSVNLNDVVSKLNSTNLDEQLSAIENIAETAQTNPVAARELLDTQVMEGLGGIIKRDTTQMKAPTPEQLELRQKILAGEKLTPEQTANANKISEMELAERNKQFAIYTVAILQKLLSDAVEQENGKKLDIKDLPMINDIVDVAKADANPMLRASALAALSYIATPENKDLLKIMFEQSQKDADPKVQEVATEALNNLAKIPDAKA